MPERLPTVSIIVKQLNDVTEVPTGALSYGTNGQATVTKVVNGSHVVTNVTVGAAENGETQITSGVKPGDKVLEREITFKAPGGGAGSLFGGGAGERRVVSEAALVASAGPVPVASREQAASPVGADSAAREPVDDRH